MNKQEEFLFIVQTLILTNGINLSLDDDAKKNRHLFSVAGVTVMLYQAIDASKKIPDNMTAMDAAKEFCFYMLDNLREEGTKVPGWFAKH